MFAMRPWLERTGKSPYGGPWGQFGNLLTRCDRQEIRDLPQKHQNATWWLNIAGQKTGEQAAFDSAVFGNSLARASPLV